MSKLGVTRSRVLRATWPSVALCLAACGGDDGGGGGDEGDFGACGQLSGCGGDLVGTWVIEDVCTDNFIQLMNGPASNEPACNGLMADTQSAATGMFTFTENTQTSNWALSIDLMARYTLACVSALADGAAVDMPAVCANFSDQYAMTSGLSGASCMIVGENCDCVFSFDQSIPSTDMYTASGGTITYANDPDPVTYCIEGDTLEMGRKILGAPILLTLRKQ